MKTTTTYINSRKIHVTQKNNLCRWLKERYFVVYNIIYISRKLTVYIIKFINNTELYSVNRLQWSAFDRYELFNSILNFTEESVHIFIKYFNILIVILLLTDTVTTIY